MAVSSEPSNFTDSPDAVRVFPCPLILQCRGGRGRTPNFKRPLREQNSRGRLIAQGKLQAKVLPDSQFAMDCSVWLTVRPKRNDCRTDLLRFSSQLGQTHPATKPCH